MHEKQFHAENAFITLTLSDENNTGSLDYREFQLFLKKLRQYVVRNLPKSKQEPTKGTPLCTRNATENLFEKFPKSRKYKIRLQLIRYYMCGEYGEKTKRPHYHAILFGYDFKDKKILSTRGGNKLYTSETLDKIWGKGHATIGEVTFESAAYVARYIMKKVNGKNQNEHYQELDTETGEIKIREPEFNHMSLKPGIGARWLEKYATDVFPEGRVVVRGHQSKSPKYYDKKYKEIDPFGYENLLFERHKEQQKRPQETSKERLATREKVTEARVKQLKRTIH